MTQQMCYLICLQTQCYMWLHRQCWLAFAVHQMMHGELDDVSKSSI